MAFDHKCAKNNKLAESKLQNSVALMRFRHVQPSFPIEIESRLFEIQNTLQIDMHCENNSHTIQTKITALLCHTTRLSVRPKTNVVMIIRIHQNSMDSQVIDIRAITK